MKNGADTNVWARMTARVVNGISSPIASSAPPRSPRRPRTSRRARPATDGGRTIGRSTIASTHPEPRNRRRARTIARGRPNATVTTRLIAVVVRLRTRAVEDDLRGQGAGERSIERSPVRRGRRPAGQGTGRTGRRAPTIERSPQPRLAPGTRIAGVARTGRAAATRVIRPALRRSAGSRTRRGSPGRPARRARPGTPAPPPRSWRPSRRPRHTWPARSPHRAPRSS